MQTLLGHSAGITSLQLLPNKNGFVSASADRTVKMWHLNSDSGEYRSAYLTHNGHYTSMLMLPGGRVLGTNGQAIKMWLLTRSDLSRTFNGHTDAVFALDLVNNSTVVSAGRDHTIKVWNVDAVSCVSTLVGHVGVVHALAVL